MNQKEHHYQVNVKWTGNKGSGTQSYKTYERNYEISAGGKPVISGSSDPAFLGDAKCWNPEDLLVAAASACHKLWYLHLCSEAGISVLSYVDQAKGTMREGKKGCFTDITLQPEITIRLGDDINRALALHHRAHELCFIANSLNFPITCQPVITHSEYG
ncbi:peroxiredoxin, SACOL1771 subfamily [Serratia proteamaculans]|jgi:organic hydroperoxide reductase OsmC/OhrA|uniref:OsmC family protein n=1 Tax=Serratia proteamaculans TaxID=28151 RepID=UPI000A15C021|nr:OsmC family protein [Serratia proteamaculans]CAI1652867.1 peroxiredoxin, SACOL1771 subfamily [Serratia proteamaculans]CAI1987733.1 peroxiredoxin, SACOL1771 subfamily [Serratia proteamaculans]